MLSRRSGPEFWLPRVRACPGPVPQMRLRHRSNILAEMALTLPYLRGQILPCMHSFCSACLAGERATEGVTARSCPVCGLDAAYAVEGVWLCVRELVCVREGDAARELSPVHICAYAGMSMGMCLCWGQQQSSPCDVRHTVLLAGEATGHIISVPSAQS